MGIGRLDEDSSSPSDSTIRSIEGGANGVVTISLEDGSSFFVPTHRVEEQQLRVGGSLAFEQVERLRLEGETELARGRGLDLLAIRDHSRRQLDAKLAARGFSRPAIRQALDQLSERGYLDDLRFARLWIAERLRRNPEGRLRLAAGLAKAGVSRELSEEALSELSEEEELDAMTRAAERLARGRVLSPEKLAAALIRKGFRVPAVRRITRIE